MKIGYARVSTQGQQVDLQLDALEKAGCELIFRETVSGAKADRPELAKLRAMLRQGDIVCIYKLDRLGRSMKHLLELVDEFQQKGVGLVSLTDSIDSSTAQGRLILNLFASLAEFERDLIRERTQAGLVSARARGRQGGRRKGLSPEGEKNARLAEMYYKEGLLGVNLIAKKLAISKVTFYKYLRHRGVEIHSKQSTSSRTNI